MTSWLAQYGVFAVFILMMIDAVFPAASEAVMLYAGALASGALTHELNVFGHHVTGLSAYLAVVLAGVLGYQLGSIGGWWIGKRGGLPFLERHGRWVHLTTERLERAERWFERWKGWAVFVGRLTPLARSFISIPAGLFGMPFVRYNVLTLLGNTIWCAVIAGAGWALGASYESFNHAFRYLEYVVVVAIAAGVVFLVIRARRKDTIPR